LGISAKELAESLNISEAEAQNIIDASNKKWD
jgi:plasmid maintenance system antidote protein VapI